MKKYFYIPIIILLLSTAQVFAQFNLAGSTITQTGTVQSTGTTTLLSNLDGFTPQISVFENVMRVLNSGTSLVVNGTFIDESGNFNLFLKDGSTFGVGGGQPGVIRVGTRTIINGTLMYSNGGVITIRPITTITNYTHYSLGNGSGTATTGKFSLFDTSINFYSTTTRSEIFFSEIAGSTIKGFISAAGQQILLRIQNGGLFDDNIISNVTQFEFHGQPVSFARNKFTNFLEGFIAFSTNSLINVVNADFIGNWNYLGWTNNGGIYYIDLYRNGQEATEAVIESKSIRAQAGGSETQNGFHIGKTHNEKLIDENGNTISATTVWFKDNFNNVFTPTLNNGEYSQTIKLKRSTNTVPHPSWAPGVWKNYYPIKKAIWGYLYEGYGEEFTTYDSFKGIGVSAISSRLIAIDQNITETNQATVDAYTTIDNLDQLYDRAKSWKVTTANIEYPTISTQPVTADGTVLDLGNRNLTINPSAGSAFAINSGTITIKSTAALVAGTKFNSIRTTGTVSTAGGATLEFGYEDATGINKYVALSGLMSTDNVLIRDNNLGADIVSVTGITGDHKIHFVAPANASDVIVRVTRPSHSSFTEDYPETDLSFVRRINLQLTQLVAESQIEMLNLVMKVLQKEEAIFRALDLSNPTLAITNTISGTTGSPTVANQLAILEILNKVFVKVIANRRKLE